MEKLEIGLEQQNTSAPIGIKKSSSNGQLEKLKIELFELQNVFYAGGEFAMLIILQGMDTSGKDSTIRNVFSGVNPQGCAVKSFKTPTEIELLHDFLWRISTSLPEKGMIKIFNRSQYEDIIFPMAHQLLTDEELRERKTFIDQFERHLQKSGTVILKFFLNISHKKQLKRLKNRLEDPKKKWKYNSEDKVESKIWDDYMRAYEFVISGSCLDNPWIIIPSDKKWYRDYLVAKAVVEKFRSLNLKYPE